jgi:uncharacterized protein YdaU (DUF1376 family)
MNPPAFQCYADDFIAGVANMTCEERGAYATMLMHSWNRNGLDNDIYRISLLIGRTTSDAEALVKAVLDMKYTLEADGKWRNRRQEIVRKTKLEYSEQQSANSSARWKKTRRGPTPDQLPPEAEASSTAAAPERPEPHYPEANIPTWAEIKAFAALDGIPESVAKDFFDHYSSKNLWLNKYHRLINARGSLAVWNNNQRKLNAGKPAPPNAKPTGAPTRGDVLKYANEKWGEDPRHVNWAVSFHTYWGDAKRNWQRNGKLIDWQIELGNQVAKFRLEKP